MTDLGSGATMAELWELEAAALGRVWGWGGHLLPLNSESLLFGLPLTQQYAPAGIASPFGMVLMA